MPEIGFAPGADTDAFAFMLANILEQNLKENPQRAKDFDALNIGVGIDVKGADLQLTLEFRSGKLIFRSGIVANPGLIVSADMDTLMEVTNLQIRYGLPNPFNETGTAVIKKLFNGELKVKGILAHPLALLRVIRVISVA
jgi:hypothetical protein